MNRQIIPVLAMIFSVYTFAQEHTNSIYNLKSRFQDQEGQERTLSELRGSPVVMAMVFTKCKSSCSLTMQDLKAIEKGLPPKTREQVRFAVFSFDSKNDTPKALKEFAQKEHVDLKRWTFFHGSPSDIRQLAALLGIRFKKIENSDQYQHSNVISILDTRGVKIYQQIGVRHDPAKSIETLQKIDAV